LLLSQGSDPNGNLSQRVAQQPQRCFAEPGPALLRLPTLLLSRAAEIKENSRIACQANQANQTDNTRARTANQSAKPCCQKRPRALCLGHVKIAVNATPMASNPAPLAPPAPYSVLHWHPRIQTLAALGMALLGPALALATFLMLLTPLEQGPQSLLLRMVLLADLVYVLVVAALILHRVLRIMARRRGQHAGSRLHLRLAGVFAALALVPAVMVAVFAGLTINIGLEGWFSDRVREAIGSSVSAAQSYEQEHVQNLQQDTLLLAAYLNRKHRQASRLNVPDYMRLWLAEGQQNIQRGLREAFVIDGAANLLARGERSYLFDYDPPTEAQIAQAQAEGLLVIRDLAQNELRALVPLSATLDRYLYVSREVDGGLFALLDDTQATAQLYQQLESERGRVLFEFSLVYLGFALLLIAAAIWVGLWIAEGLSQPIGQLMGAAQKVGAGDLDVQVPAERGNDEIAMLGHYFNQMIRQLKGQRDRLVQTARQTEQRRRMFDSVLGSVSSGVIGLDTQGHVAFVNKSARRMLGWGGEAPSGALQSSVPEFAPLLARLYHGIREDVQREDVQQEVKLTRRRRLASLLVRMSPRWRDDGSLEGYVVAFDDITNLVAAQRMAAWSDVAKRIAHEIKNPLTPIRLSAERIRRKFAQQTQQKGAGADPALLAQMVDVIVRQTEYLQRIIDEFSRFARMPKSNKRRADLVELVQAAIVLQRSGLPHVRFETDISKQPVMMDLDAAMISQMLINLVKNAGEAIEARMARYPTARFAPVIRVFCHRQGAHAVIRVSDNGIGLPEDRTRLFEPHITTRADGSGLGLPIVRRIVEEHSGTMTLEDATPFPESAAAAQSPAPSESVPAEDAEPTDPAVHRGAVAEVVLPLGSAGVAPHLPDSPDPKGALPQPPAPRHRP